jgi:protein-glutamine gamma-glutamyltransferase
VAADLEVPAALDPRVRALAERLGGGKDPADAAAAIERWLTESLRYTRDLPGPVPDPVASFLFDRRAGHCELFSSAMVLMLRSLGIPARNVTGYFGGRSTDAGYYAVRAGDAHSWVEAYFPEVGFVPFDPTPPSGRGGVQEGAWAKAVLLWDALQQRWRAFIVDYDLIAQAQAMRRVGQLLSETGRRLAGKGGGADRLRAMVETTLVVLLAGALLLAVRRVRGRHRPERTPALTPDQRRALRLWRAARSRLRRGGIGTRTNGTARELAREVPALEEVAAAYARVRWGGERLSASEVRKLLRRLDGRLDPVAPDARP